MKTRTLRTIAMLVIWVGYSGVLGCFVWLLWFISKHTAQ